MSTTDMKAVVKEKYGQAALRVMTGGSSCCGATAASGLGCDPITSNLYDSSQAGQVPDEAMLASLGCGNPTALAKLNPGEVVLDLGSGGGVDVLLSAKRVGPSGKAYGLDMTDEMLALANENKRRSGAENVEFLKGEIEHIPLPDSTVSDVVTQGEVPNEIRQSVLLWVGCIAGALEENEYRAKLLSAGFDSIEIEPTRIYRIEDAREFLSGQNIDVDAIAPQVDGKFMSAFVRAVKPERNEPCCGPTCCQ
jgi:arsenite methyltransferase